MSHRSQGQWRAMPFDEEHSNDEEDMVVLSEEAQREEPDTAADDDVSTEHGPSNGRNDDDDDDDASRMRRPHPVRKLSVRGDEEKLVLLSRPTSSGSSSSGGGGCASRGAKKGLDGAPCGSRVPIAVEEDDDEDDDEMDRVAVIGLCNERNIASSGSSRSSAERGGGGDDDNDDVVAHLDGSSTSDRSGAAAADRTSPIRRCVDDHPVSSSSSSSSSGLLPRKESQGAAEQKGPAVGVVLIVSPFRTPTKPPGRPAGEQGEPRSNRCDADEKPAWTAVDAVAHALLVSNETSDGEGRVDRGGILPARGDDDVVSQAPVDGQVSSGSHAQINDSSDHHRGAARRNAHRFLGWRSDPHAEVTSASGFVSASAGDRPSALRGPRLQTELEPAGVATRCVVSNRAVGTQHRPVSPTTAVATHEGRQVPPRSAPDGATVGATKPRARASHRAEVATATTLSSFNHHEPHLEAAAIVASDMIRPSASVAMTKRIVPPDAPRLLRRMHRGGAHGGLAPISDDDGRSMTTVASLNAMTRLAATLFSAERASLLECVADVQRQRQALSVRVDALLQRTSSPSSRSPPSPSQPNATLSSSSNRYDVPALKRPPLTADKATSPPPPSRSSPAMPDPLHVPTVRGGSEGLEAASPSPPLGHPHPPMRPLNKGSPFRLNLEEPPPHSVAPTVRVGHRVAALVRPTALASPKSERSSQSSRDITSSSSIVGPPTSPNIDKLRRIEGAIRAFWEKSSRLLTASADHETYNH